jgi:hypothetical protein
MACDRADTAGASTGGHGPGRQPERGDAGEVPGVEGARSDAPADGPLGQAEQGCEVGPAEGPQAGVAATPGPGDVDTRGYGSQWHGLVVTTLW